jgi:chromosome segregation ATPase
MTANGDERATAAWERVEAKLDRLGEIQGEHGRTLARLDRRLSRVEGDLDLVKLLLESARHDVDRKLDRLTDELLAALGQETRVELLAAQGLNHDRLDALERRVAALETKA